ncbi:MULTISPECIES: hypothetical protein [Halorussus]|uniref:hypothetical protein n=1 Tax=Halorussus TaxID=1070314 RepID=UPI000E20F8AF|nr:MULTISPECIES: hypothetical protein [Halorussus]NHN61051.1 hypothetical protein [Halorussus sp. JP-T4]
MERRELLARFGAVLAGASLGGCLGGNRPGGGTGQPEDGTTDGGTTTGDGESTLTDTGLEVTDAGCGTPGNDASVEFAAGSDSVVVTGTLRASDPCHTAELADASYDPETGTLEVTVAAVQSDGANACAECIARIAYEATFAFDGGLPATVTVVHDAMDESTTVATAES